MGVIFLNSFESEGGSFALERFEPNDWDEQF
jgi:hypothetical protein